MQDIISQISLSDFKHITPIQVRFNDTDQMGHVTNMQYLSYCDIARLKYFNEVFNEKIGYSVESLVIASVKLDFVHQIFMDELIDVRSKVSYIGNKSVQMLQLICNSESGQIKCLAHTVMSGFDYIEQHSILIPQRWKDSILNYDIKVDSRK